MGVRLCGAADVPLVTRQMRLVSGLRRMLRQLRFLRSRRLREKKINVKTDGKTPSVFLLGQ